MYCQLNYFWSFDMLLIRALYQPPLFIWQWKVISSLAIANAQIILRKESSSSPTVNFKRRRTLF